MHGPPGQKFLHFHTVFGKYWPESRLAPPLRVGAPLGNPGFATGKIVFRADPTVMQVLQVSEGTTAGGGSRHEDVTSLRHVATVAGTDFNQTGVKLSVLTLL